MEARAYFPHLPAPLGPEVKSPYPLSLQPWQVQQALQLYLGRCYPHHAAAARIWLQASLKLPRASDEEALAFVETGQASSHHKSFQVLQVWRQLAHTRPGQKSRGVSGASQFLSMPSFVIPFLIALLADLSLVYQLLLATDESTMLMIFLLLIFLVPMTGLLAAPGALAWQRQVLTDPSGPGPVGSALGRMTCVSSLLFLLSTSVIRLASGGLDPHNFYALFVLVYLLVQVIRLHYGMWINLVVSLYLLLKPDRPGDRPFAVGALLGAGAGLGLVASGSAPLAQRAIQGLVAQSSSPGGNLLAWALLATMGFAYGLMWGGALLWGLSRGQSR